MFLCLYLLLVLKFVSCNDELYNDVPGVAMEYKVHIDAGKEDCYWQYVHPQATIYVNMQVNINPLSNIDNIIY